MSVAHHLMSLVCLTKAKPFQMGYPVGAAASVSLCSGIVALICSTVGPSQSYSRNKTAVLITRRKQTIRDYALDKG